MSTLLKSEHDQRLQQDFVYALAKSRAVLYAARASGLYRSQDSGAVWHKVDAFPDGNDPFSATAVIAQDNEVFAGVNGGVIYSEDDGAHWKFAALPSPPPRITALAVSPNYAEDGFIAAGTAEDGVFISTDRGLNWAAWNFGLIDHAVYALAISSRFAVDRTLFAGTETGLYRSQNGGRGWRELPFPTESAPILSLALSPTFESDGTLYAGTEQHGLYVSRDFGLNWAQIKGNMQSSVVNAIHISRTAHTNSVIWLLLEDQVISSSDAGLSWESQISPIPSGKQAISMLPLSTASGGILVGFADGDILTL